MQKCLSQARGYSVQHSQIVYGHHLLDSTVGSCSFEYLRCVMPKHPAQQHHTCPVFTGTQANSVLTEHVCCSVVQVGISVRNAPYFVSQP